MLMMSYFQNVESLSRLNKYCHNVGFVSNQNSKMI